MPNASLRFPAEWEPQSAVLIAWPHAGTDWAARLAEAEGGVTRSAGGESTTTRQTRKTAHAQAPTHTSAPTPRSSASWETITGRRWRSCGRSAVTPVAPRLTLKHFVWPLARPS